MTTHDEFVKTLPFNILEKYVYNLFDVLINLEGEEVDPVLLKSLTDEFDIYKAEIITRLDLPPKKEEPEEHDGVLH